MTKIDIDLEKKQKKRALTVSLILIAAASTITGSTNWIYFSDSPSISILLFSTAGVSLLALWLNLRGMYMAAAILAMTIAFATVYLNLFLAGGLRDPGAVSIPVAIVFAGMLFGHRVIPIITVISVIIVGIVGWLEIAGIKIITSNVMNFNTFIVIGVFTVCSGMIIDVIMKNHRSMLERIRDDSERLLESERKYRTVYNGVNDAIIVADGYTAELLEANERLRDIFGHTPETAGQLTLGDISSGIPPYTENALKKYLLEARNAPQTVEWQAKSANGSFFWTEITMRHAMLHEQERVLLIIRDISGRKKAEEQLVNMRNQQSIAMLSSGIAHDLANSLTGITSSVSFLKPIIEKSAHPDCTTVNEYMEIIGDSASHLNDLVKQLSMLSRNEEVVFSFVDLAKVCDHAVKLCRKTFQDQITIKWESPAFPAPVYGNKTQLEQVLLNLCINAAHAMTTMRGKNETQGGDLRLAIRKTENEESVKLAHALIPWEPYWEIAVSDTGVGIDDSTRRQIFDPYFTTKKHSGGTGLGLSMVQSIILKHAGHLHVESSPGKGSTFFIYLPVLDANT